MRLVPGEGRIVVNNREISEHIPSPALIEDIKQPLTLTETAGTYDVLVNVHGGGLSGQAGAIRHGIARALLEADPEYRATLKRAGLLTRDARMKERKNTVLKALVVHLNSQNVNRFGLQNHNFLVVVFCIFSQIQEVIQCFSRIVCYTLFINNKERSYNE